MAGNVAEVILRVRAELKELERATAGLEDVQQEAKQADDALDALDDSASKVGRSSAQLAGALDMVAPGAGALARGLADVADVGEVAATVAGALGLSLGSLAAIAAPIALIVGGIALAWRDYEADAAAAAEATAKLREEQERLNEAMSGVRTLAATSASELEKLAVANGKLSQEQYELNELGRAWSDQLEQARAPLEAIREELQATIDGSSEHGAKLADVEQKLRDANEAAAAGYRAAEQNAEIARETAESDRVLAERAKAKADADRKAGEAARDRAKSETELAAALKAEEEFTAGIDTAIAGLGDLFDLTQNKIDEADDAIDNTIAGVEAVGTTATTSARSVRTLADALGGMSSTVAAMKSPEALLSAVASTGPWGAAIAGIIDFVKDFDESLASFKDFHMEIMGSIGSLPETLAEHMQTALSEGGVAAIEAIPKFMQSLAENIGPMIEAIVKSLPIVIGALIEALIIGMPRAGAAFLVSLFDPATWKAIGEAFVEGFQEAFGGSFSGGDLLSGTGGSRVAAGISTGGISEIVRLFSGSYSTGSDYVPRTGLALVHQGERITPATGRNAPMMGGRGGGGGGGDVHVHMNGFAVGTVDQFVRELNRHLGTNNRKLSWATGS